MKNDLRARILAGALVTVATTNSIGVVALGDEKAQSEDNNIKNVEKVDSEKIEIEKNIEEDIKKDLDEENNEMEKAENENKVANDENEHKDIILEKEIIEVNEISNESKLKTVVNFPVKHNIMENNEVSKEQFKSFLLAQQKKYGFKYDISVSIDEFLRIAYEEASKEGVRGDIVVAQAVHESGYFKFGGVLTAKDNNFCGLGVTGDGSKLSFSSARIGLRAQVQHLKAYASTATLNQAVVDPRFKYVTRGVAPSLEELAGKWAVPGYDKNKYASLQEVVDNNDSYGQNIYKLIASTKGYSGTNLEDNNIPEEKPEQTPDVKPEEKPETPTVTGRGEVINISSRLNIRKGPGTNYAVIGSLINSQKINIYGEESGFYKIDFISNGTTSYGYVSKNYIKSYENKPEVTPEVKPDTPNKPDIANKPENNVNTMMGQVTGVSSRLNVRAGAGTSHKIIGSLKNGEKVKIESEQNGWYKIISGNITGYVSKTYMKVVQESTNGNSNNQEKKGTVKVNGVLNIRSGAGTNHSIIGKLFNGNKVTIIGESGSWYKINYNGKEAYVSKNYVV